MTHCLLQTSACLPRSPLTSPPRLQPMHLLAGPRQHGLICLGEPGTARGENKKQTGKSRGGTLGMWHRAHRDVPSGASQDPQPKNTVRHPDTDLCLLSVPS